MPYATAAAFRTALKAKFTEIAVNDLRLSVAELQRQFTYDRILSRRFSAADADRWILKGPGALLARLPVARHSKDIDLYYAERATEPDVAVAAPARVADRDIGAPYPITVLTSSAQSSRPTNKQAKSARAPEWIVYLWVRVISFMQVQYRRLVPDRGQRGAALDPR